MGGYLRGEVDRFMAEVARAMEDYIDQIGQLHVRIGELDAQLAKYRESEELLKDSVILARQTSDELIAASRSRAESIVREAEGEGAAIRRRLAGLAAQREQFEYEFHGLLAGFMHRLEQGNPRLAAPPQRSQAAPAPIAPQPAPEQAAPDEEVAAPAVPKPVEGRAGVSPAIRSRLAGTEPGSTSRDARPTNQMEQAEAARDADADEFAAALEQGSNDAAQGGQPDPYSSGGWPAQEQDATRQVDMPLDPADVDEDAPTTE